MHRLMVLKSISLGLANRQRTVNHDTGIGQGVTVAFFTYKSALTANP